MVRGAAICIALVLAVAGVYAQSLGFGFVHLDDDEYVYANPFIRNGLSADGAAWVLTSEHGGNWHPLTGLSHMLDCTLFGVDPGAHHAVNVVFHIANTLLLFGLLRSMTGALWRSALVAALFSLHPLRVESVAWISERKDVLSTFFWFLATWAYAAYARRGGVKRYALVVLLFGLGLMAKPMLVTLPFTLLLLDYWPLGRWNPAGRLGAEAPPAARRAGAGWLIVEKLPLIALAAISCVVTFCVQQGSGAVARLDAVPLPDRLANAAVAYASYIGDMLWPAGLSVLYPHPNLPGGTPWAWWLAAGAAAFLAAATAAALILRRRRYVPVGWFWYVGTLVPVIGLVQVGSEARADRYTYLPLIGLFLAVVWGAAEAAEHLRIKKPAAAAAACALLAALAAAAFVQTRHWKDSISLFEHALSTTPNNSAAHVNLGIALMDEGAGAAAAAHFAAALRIHPDFPAAHNNLGMILEEAGRTDEAVEHYAAALRAAPAFVEALNNMAIALAKLNRPEEAQAAFEQAIAIAPDRAESHFNFALLLARLGRSAEAIRHLQAAVRIDPDYVAAHSNLGSLLAAQGRLDAAIDHFRAAAAIDPQNPAGHYNLGLAAETLGRDSEAAAHFAEAVRLDPANEKARSRLESVRRRLDRQP